MVGGGWWVEKLLAPIHYPLSTIHASSISVRPALSSPAPRRPPPARQALPPAPAPERWTESAKATTFPAPQAASPSRPSCARPCCLKDRSAPCSSKRIPLPVFPSRGRG